MVRSLLGIILYLAASSASAAMIFFQDDAVEPFIGLRMDRLELASYRDGELHSVRHQWLAWSPHGWPYFRTDNASHRTEESDRVGSQDRLLAKSSDAGERLRKPPDAVLGELSITVKGQQRYFYVLSRAPFQGFPQPVTLQQNSQCDPLRLKTPFYQLEFIDGNLFRWGDFVYYSYRDPNGDQRTLLDSLKLRLSAGIFSSNARVTLTNKNLDPQIRQVIQGPLATLVYATTRVRIAGIRLLTVHNYFLLMENQITIHSRFTLPKFAATVLRDPRARLSVDGHKLQGARLKTSWTGEREAIVDGQLSETEQAMLRRAVPAKNWLHFDTGRDFSLLARLHFDEDIGTHAQLIFQDNPDLNDLPERFPGQQPNVGFELQRIPFGESFYFVAELLFSENAQK